MPKKGARKGRRGSAARNEEEENIPQAVRDFRIQAAAKTAEVESLMTKGLESMDRKFEAFLSGLDPAILDMPFIKFLSDTDALSGAPPDPFDFVDDAPPPAKNPNLTILNATAAANGTLNATAMGEETFCLPKVPLGKAKRGRPPPAKSSRAAAALQTPAAFAAPLGASLATPATELRGRGAKPGEMLFSHRGSPVVQDPDCVAPSSGGHANTVIKTRDGDATIISDSPYDPNRPTPSINLDETEMTRLRNLHTKIGALLKGD